MTCDWQYIEQDPTKIASVITKPQTPQPFVYMSDQHTFQDLR